MVTWLRDELVLVGDAVLRNAWKGLRSNSSDAIELSRLLRRGQLHPGVELPIDFRSPDSIQRKSYDLVSASVHYQGTPTKGGKATQSITAAFEADPELMRAKATAIRHLLLSGLPVLPTEIPDLDEAIGAQEGGIVERLAKRRERDPNLRKAKIRAVLNAGGDIACEACGLDFGKVYGARGAGYIEVHHLNPLHVSGPVATRLDDLALVCANCHAMCHRGPWITPSDVAALIAAQR